MPNVPGLWQTQSVQCSGMMHWRELKLLSWERGGRKSTTRGGTGLPTRHTTTETLHDWMHRGTDLTTFKQVLTYSQHTHTHTQRPFFQYQKGKTNLDFTEARDSEWQCHQLGHMQVCTSLQTDNHTSTPPLSFFYRPDALPATQSTATKHWRPNIQTYNQYFNTITAQLVINIPMLCDTL